MRRYQYWFFLLLLSGRLLAAGPVELIGAEVPPFVISNDINAHSGVASVILMEAARRMGQDATLETMPFSRALLETRRRSYALVVPTARIPSREHQFIWIAPLFQEAFVLYTNRQRHPKPLHVSELAHLTIGVMRDSVSANLLRHYPEYRVETTLDEQLNARKLQRGRIDVWAVSLNAGRYAQQLAGLDPDDLVKGDTLSLDSLYLAASPRFPLQEITRWRETIEQMQKDGKIQEIKQKYHYIDP